jgi:hypothetical protein
VLCLHFWFKWKFWWWIEFLWRILDLKWDEIFIMKIFFLYFLSNNEKNHRKGQHQESRRKIIKKFVTKLKIDFLDSKFYFEHQMKHSQNPPLSQPSPHEAYQSKIFINHCNSIPKYIHEFDVAVRQHLPQQIYEKYARLTLKCLA